MSAPVWRIQHLVACADRLHRQLWEASDPARPPADAAQALHPIRQEAAGHVATVDRLAREAGVLVAQLPTPSLQAYGWMLWLSDGPDRPGLQVDSLRRLRQIGQRLGEPLHWAQLKPMRVLLRSRRRPPQFELQVNGLFVGAPDEVLEAVYQRGRGRARPPEVDRIDRYTRGPMAQALFQAMRADGAAAAASARSHPAQVGAERTGFPPPSDSAEAARSTLPAAFAHQGGEAPIGRYHDLRAVFQRVNQGYFQGRLAQPRLRWSRRLNRRHLGHYRPLEDELQVSAILDRSDVPPEVLDYLMFHELLHKALGISTVGGRRRSHTPAFRAAETQFPHYDRVQRWLRRHL